MMTYVDEGCTAHAQGARRSECPYVQGSDAALWWLSGWDYAAQHAEQLELVAC